MHKYNKIRGILRAKQGSQISKFWPGGQFNTGSEFPTELPDGMMNDGNKNYLDESTLITSTPVAWNSRNGELSRTAVSSMKDFKIPISKITPFSKTPLSFGQKVKVAGKIAGKELGNFANNNQLLILGGINMMSDKLFGGTENSSEFNTIDGALGTLQSVGGPVGWYATAAKVGLNAINKIGSREIEGHTMNTYLKNRAGNYGGLMALNSKVESDKTKEFGLFNSGGYKRALGRADKLFGQLGTFENIINTADNQFAMAGNDLYQLGYEMQQNGGYPAQFLRASKKGGTLTQKIDLVKSRKFNQVIDVNTKLVEEFKEGGKLEIFELEIEWEPVIDDIIDYWEPIIDDIELYREGGKTKEELETPEIEETNQKNLIPEGALHKNKHHMEHTEGLTQKGIPVIDNEGEQLAEIELDEIIFTLEVTKKLEELYKDGSNEAAIEAGKLLVKEILFNTDDRTGLIAKCEKGGKL